MGSQIPASILLPLGYHVSPASCVLTVSQRRMVSLLLEPLSTDGKPNTSVRITLRRREDCSTVDPVLVESR